MMLLMLLLWSQGIITKVELDVRRAFHLRETQEMGEQSAVIGQLSAIARSAERVKVWFFVDTPRAQVFRFEETTDAPRGNKAIFLQQLEVRESERKRLFIFLCP